MSGVRLLVGTRKGAFILTSDGKVYSRSNASKVRPQWEHTIGVKVSGNFCEFPLNILRSSPLDSSTPRSQVAFHGPRLKIIAPSERTPVTRGAQLRRGYLASDTGEPRAPLRLIDK